MPALAASYDFVGYTFRAEQYCPEDLLDALPTGPGEAFDGWDDLSGQPVEDSLRELAFAFSIDREDEASFDSDDFPKVIFRDQTTEDDVCGACGKDL
ncbi:hypothetical protein V6N00_13925 [Tersicoccus sp. MR15.9]|uniref:hypothetical protein n=1 Tax=Tersicoccus mangrovi TaxID=3121635 RepID=UPI002FE52CBD